MADVSNSKIMHAGTGIHDAGDACIVLVKTEWNAVIVDELERGCIAKLREHGVGKIVSLTVPGAIEIPFGIRAYWENKKKKPDAFIALGCVIRGGTPHFEYVCKAVTEGVMQLNLQLPVPTIFGLLTVENEHQATERIGGKHGHRGEESAMAALKMISLQKSLKK
jgi:6,7-dimethyl-8-ribityllumazine synthase